MTDKLAAALRESLAGFDRDWVEDAIARAASTAEPNDPDAICAAVISALHLRLAAMNADTAALERENDATERNSRADDATYGIAINRYADVEQHPHPTIH